jgi:hypothetical protein
MAKLAAGSLLRTVYSSADAGALRIAVKGRLNLQLPPVAQWEAFWSVQDFRFLAQSRHKLVHWTCPLFGGKADIAFALHMSAFDSKRTLIDPHNW